jgi:hypothetical protein
MITDSQEPQPHATKYNGRLDANVLTAIAHVWPKERHGERMDLRRDGDFSRRLLPALNMSSVARRALSTAGYCDDGDVIDGARLWNDLGSAGLIVKSRRGNWILPEDLYKDFAAPHSSEIIRFDGDGLVISLLDEQGISAENDQISKSDALAKIHEATKTLGLIQPTTRERRFLREPWTSVLRARFYAKGISEALLRKYLFVTGQTEKNSIFWTCEIVEAWRDAGSPKAKAAAAQSAVAPQEGTVPSGFSEAVDRNGYVALVTTPRNDEKTICP